MQIIVFFIHPVEKQWLTLSAVSLSHATCANFVIIGKQTDRFTSAKRKHMFLLVNMYTRDIGI